MITIQNYLNKAKLEAEEAGKDYAFSGKTLQEMLLSMKHQDRTYRDNAIKGFKYQLNTQKQEGLEK